GIDGLVSSAIGACAASGSPTWVLTGDLGLFHDSNGLAAVRDSRAPLRIIVFNNDGGGIFEFLPQADLVERGEFEALVGTALGLDVARLAALHGLGHRRVARVEEIADAVADGATLIEIATERRANLDLHRRLTAAAVGAVERAVA